jgi:hypothetical protein
MSGRSVLGIVLIAGGILALAYQGFSYTLPKRAVDVGPIHLTKDERHRYHFRRSWGVGINWWNCGLSHRSSRSVIDNKEFRAQKLIVNKRR